MGNKKYEVWDLIFCAKVPNQENSSRTTARPVIIYEDLLETAIIIPITTVLEQERNYKYTLIINKNSKDGKLLHLDEKSMLALDRACRVPKSVLVFRIGKCSEDLIEDIESMIKTAEDEGFTKLKDL